jgi:hypothetical protein
VLVPNSHQEDWCISAPPLSLARSRNHGGPRVRSANARVHLLWRDRCACPLPPGASSPHRSPPPGWGWIGFLVAGVKEIEWPAWMGLGGWVRW